MFVLLSVPLMQHLCTFGMDLGLLFSVICVVLWMRLVLALSVGVTHYVGLSFFCFPPFFFYCQCF